MTPQLNQQQAVNVLIQAVRIGQSKGAYSLEDAATIAAAIAVFVKTEPGEEEPILNPEDTVGDAITGHA